MSEDNEQPAEIDDDGTVRLNVLGDVKPEHIDALLKHVGTITDGVWEPKKDIPALFSLLGSLLGYASAAFLALKTAGIF